MKRPSSGSSLLLTIPTVPHHSWRGDSPRPRRCSKQQAGVATPAPAPSSRHPSALPDAVLAAVMAVLVEWVGLLFSNKRQELPPLFFLTNVSGALGRGTGWLIPSSSS